MVQTSHSPVPAEAQADVPATPERPLRSPAPKRWLGLKRGMAWALELGLVAGSGMLPWAGGELIRQHFPDQSVPVNPVVMQAQAAIARTLGRPRRTLVTEVPPLTNLLWFGAIALPVAMAGSQLYLLRRTGRTWPKQWLGLQVVTIDGQLPSTWTVIQRELIGRWGLPLVAAYSLWVAGGAYPRPMILATLSLAALAGEGLTAQTNRPRRALHDYLAHTQVILSQGAQLPVKYRWPQDPSAPRPTSRLGAIAGLTLAQEDGGLTSVILSPDAYSPWDMGYWIRRYPMPLAGAVVLGGLAIIVTGMVTTLVYAQQQQTQRTVRQQDNELFLALVDTLTGQASREEQQGAAIALGSTQDPRAIPLLVDMLAQTDDPALLDSLQQSLITLGPATLSPLRQLNQKLANDIASLPPAEQTPYRLRQRTVKRTLAKLLRLHDGEQWRQVDLSETDFGQIFDPPDTYHLVLQKQNLAGIQWRNSVLSGADLAQSRFFDPGPDQRIDTYDDWITDFSRSDLTEANLAQADLRGVTFYRASLLRANLTAALARYADLEQANISSARLIETDLAFAQLQAASLVGADLTRSNFEQAQLQGARLAQVTGVGSNFTRANLAQIEASGSDFTDATFGGANLAAADLSHSRLQGTDFTQANLQNANFQGADLIGIQLKGANLAGADFQDARFVHPAAVSTQSFITPVETVDQGNQLAGVDFSKARNLSPHQIAYICAQGGRYTDCPPADQAQP